MSDLGASKIALDASAATILPVVVIAQTLQFRSDRVFERFSRRVSWRRYLVLAAGFVAVVCFLGMLLGWFSAVAELSDGHVNTTDDLLVRIGFVAGILALLLGGLEALDRTLDEGLDAAIAGWKRQNDHRSVGSDPAANSSGDA